MQDILLLTRPLSSIIFRRTADREEDVGAESMAENSDDLDQLLDSKQVLHHTANGFFFKEKIYFSMKNFGFCVCLFAFVNSRSFRRFG